MCVFSLSDINKVMDGPFKELKKTCENWINPEPVPRPRPGQVLDDLLLTRVILLERTLLYCGMNFTPFVTSNMFLYILSLCSSTNTTYPPPSSSPTPSTPVSEQRPAGGGLRVVPEAARQGADVHAGPPADGEQRDGGPPAATPRRHLHQAGRHAGRRRRRRPAAPRHRCVCVCVFVY